MTRPASDRCARPGCAHERHWHPTPNGGGCYYLVDSAQDFKQVCDCSAFVESPPVTSTKETGEAAVREIAGAHYDPDEPADWEDLVSVGRAAYAAGRAKGREEAFRECKVIATWAQSQNPTMPKLWLDLLARQSEWIADTIEAARAKEGT